MRELCPFEGNSDLYGLGVRLGVYAQLLATALANHVLPDALVSAVDTNVIFLVAILAAMLKSTVGKELSTVEAFVMLQIVLTFLVSMVNIDGARWVWIAAISSVFSEQDQLVDAHFKVSRFGSFWRCGIRSLAGGYNLWFWFYGQRRLDRASSCNTQIFLFAKLNALGPVRYLFEALSVVYVLYCLNSWALLLIWADKEDDLLKNMGEDNSTGKALKRQPTLEGEANSHKLKVAPRWLGFAKCILTGLKAEEEVKSQARAKKLGEELLKMYGGLLRARRRLGGSHKIWRRSLFFGDALFVVWTILTVELSLRWSQVYGVYQIQSTSQLIPLVVGLSGLIQSLLAVFGTSLTKKVELKPKELLPVWKRTDRQHLKPLIWQYRVGEDHVARFQFREDLRNRQSFDDRDQCESFDRISACKMTRAAAELLAPCPALPDSFSAVRFSNDKERSIQLGPYNGVYYGFPQQALDRSMSCNDIDLKSSTVHRWYSRNRLAPNLREAFPSGYVRSYRMEDGSQRSIRIRPLTSPEYSSPRSSFETTTSVITAPLLSYWRSSRSTAHQQSMVRAGRDQVSPADIEVLFGTGKCLYVSLTQSKTLQIPLLSMQRSWDLDPTSRRFSQDEQGSQYDVRYELTENPFHTARVSGRSHRAHLLGGPWKWKKLIFYYVMLVAAQVLYMPWLAFLSLKFEVAPLITSIWRCRDSSLKWPSQPRNTATRVKDALRRSWGCFVYMPRVLAHHVVEAYTPENETRLRHTLLPTLHLILLALIFSHVICFTLWYVTLFNDGRWHRLDKKRRLLWVVMLILIVLAAPMMLIFSMLVFADRHKWRSRDESGSGSGSGSDDPSSVSWRETTSRARPTTSSPPRSQTRVNSTRINPNALSSTGNQITHLGEA